MIKAKAPGKATITASYKLEGKNRQTSCVVNVQGPKLSQSKLTVPLRMTKTLQVKNGSGKMKWTTSNKKVATVKNGKMETVD